MGTTKSDSKRPKPKRRSMVPRVMPDQPKFPQIAAQVQRQRRRQQPWGHFSGPELVAAVIETLPRLAGCRSSRLLAKFQVLSLQRSGRHSAAQRRLPARSAGLLLSRLFRLGFRYAASDEKIGSGKARVRLLENPTSRPCRAIRGKVVCGAQDAEPTGGDHLQGGQTVRFRGKKRAWVGADGVWSQRGMSVSLRS